MSVVLSIFPGLDVLGMGFEAEGFTIVAGPDVILGRDLRQWDARPLRGRIDGVIGGDPCQRHSALANLVRAKGLEPTFPDMTEDFARIVEEVEPAWFLRENVPRAPDIKPLGYEVTSFLLDNCWLGEAQRRKRCFWFGWPQERGPAPNLRRWIPGAALELAESYVCADAGHDKLDGEESIARYRTHPVQCTEGLPPERSQKRYSLPEMLSLQGLPTDLLEHSPLTMQGKRKLVGNAVALPTAKAIARAVRMALAEASR